MTFNASNQFISHCFLNCFVVLYAECYKSYSLIPGPSDAGEKKARQAKDVTPLAQHQQREPDTLAKAFNSCHIAALLDCGAAHRPPFEAPPISLPPIMRSR